MLRFRRWLFMLGGVVALVALQQIGVPIWLLLITAAALLLPAVLLPGWRFWIVKLAIGAALMVATGGWLYYAVFSEDAERKGFRLTFKVIEHRIEPNGVPVIAAMVHVANTGPASIVQGLALSVLVPGRDPLNAENLIMSRPIGIPSFGVNVTFANTIQYLGRSPVLSGDTLTGIEMFRITGLKEEDLYRSGVVYRFTCVDINGTRYSVDEVQNGAPLARPTLLTPPIQMPPGTVFPPKP